MPRLGAMSKAIRNGGIAMVMDLVFIALGAALWLLMVLLVRGLERLAPVEGGRP
jgi:hypothetical protein